MSIDTANECNPDRAAERATAVLEPSRGARDTMIAALRALRVHQWSKNALLLVPLVLAHEIGNRDILARGFGAAFLFSLCASAVYVLNDMVDAKADRLHPTKHRRPFAAGTLPLAAGAVMIPSLLIVAFGIAAVTLPREFQIMMGLYLVLTTAYTLALKRKVVADVLLLAALYMLRVVAGGAATGTLVSPWLLAFSMFFFLSLAFMKRYAELLSMGAGSDTSGSGRGYVLSDAEMIRTVGPASGYMSVLILALYINGDSVTRLYSAPGLLWLVGPCLLYWLTRHWFIAHRGRMDIDPVLFALRDRGSWATLAMILIIAVLATVS